MNELDRIVFLLFACLVGGIGFYLINRPASNSPSESDASDPRSALEQGRAVFKSEGCNACHSVDGTKHVGPTMRGLYGTKQTLKNGTEVKVNESYLRESIRQPERKIVEGYPNNMPSYDHLSDEQIQQLVEFIKSLSDSNNGRDRKQ